jgi:hypothetical protein
MTGSGLRRQPLIVRAFSLGGAESETVLAPTMKQYWYSARSSARADDALAAPP